MGHLTTIEFRSAWYRAFIAKTILFRATLSAVRAAKYPAYQANITTYTVAALSWFSDGKFDFERVWTHQAISPELRALLSQWASEIDQTLRATSGNRMPSEWAKKIECRDALRAVKFEVSSPAPPELATAARGDNRPNQQRRSWFRR